MNKVNVVGTMDKVKSIGTIDKLGIVGTMTKVSTIGTISKLNVVGTCGIYGFNGGTITKVKVDSNGIVYMGLYEKKFYETQQVIAVAQNVKAYGTVIDTSKYADTTWYIRNKTTVGLGPVTVQLSVAPTAHAAYVPIEQTIIIADTTPQVITNEYYMHYTRVQIVSSNVGAQDIEVWFNGRY